MLTKVVNFFGHAAVASWTKHRGPGFALGAMLPDFATMSGARLASCDDADVTAGIELHHATDKVFHTLPAFTGLMKEMDALLAAGGCARGPKRAVSHIGVELLLDGVLVREQSYRDAYAAGLAHEIAGAVWRDSGDNEHYAVLMRRLRAHGVPDDLQKPEAIGMRLQRMLSYRPLLAPNTHDMTVIRAALVEFKPRVEVAAETILRGVRAQLG